MGIIFFIQSHRLYDKDYQNLILQVIEFQQLAFFLHLVHYMIIA